MNNNYNFHIKNPKFVNLGYIVAIANVNDKHDRSAPSNFHWKILKCRMIIFSSSSILASPDRNDVKQVHLIFNKIGDDYDKINSLFLKFSLEQEGGIRKVTPEVFQTCFQYTMTAKLAPMWNILGQVYLINNRDFLTCTEPQPGIKYKITSDEIETIMELKPVKIHLLRSNDDFLPGEWIRVLPSLFKATVDECFERLPETTSNFKSYKDLRRHWKNIHGYRLPEEELTYCKIQFWRGEPLTYPRLCVIRDHPLITPIKKTDEKKVLTKFFNCLKAKMPHILGIQLLITPSDNDMSNWTQTVSERINDTQAVSLCTQTQH